MHMQNRMDVLLYYIRCYYYYYYQYGSVQLGPCQMLPVYDAAVAVEPALAPVAEQIDRHRTFGHLQMGEREELKKKTN